MTMTRPAILIGFLFATSFGATATLQAAPAAYVLDADRSSVEFTWFYGNNPVNGQIAVADADITIDFEAFARSDVTVSLDATSARAGFLFATQTLRGPLMFDGDNFPRISFASSGFRNTGDTVEMDGAVTIRGVTQPLVMQATLYRQPGTEPADRDHMAIELVGAVDRHAFGMSGFPNDVGAEVQFRILAYIDRAP